MVKHNITIQDSSPLITYSGEWSDLPDNPDYGNYSGYAAPGFISYHNISSGSFDLAFNGTAIYVYGTRSPDGGSFLASIVQQDSPDHSVDTFSGNSTSPQKEFHSLLYFHQNMVARSIQSVGSRAPLVYNLHVENTGGGNFVLDFIIVESDVIDQNISRSSVSSITLDDTSPAFSYDLGEWSDVLPLSSAAFTKYYNNNTQHTTTELGSQVRIDFRGSGIEVHGEWFVGGFRAELDNFSAMNIASGPAIFSNNILDRPRELLCAFDGLEEGDHALTLTHTASPVGSGTQSLSIDYAIVSTSDPTNLDGLVSASSNSSNSSGTQPSASSIPSSKSSSHGGTIAGGVIGGIIFIILFIGLSFWIYHRRHRKPHYPTSESPEALETRPDPYFLEPHIYNTLHLSSSMSSSANQPSHSTTAAIPRTADTADPIGDSPIPARAVNRSKLHNPQPVPSPSPQLPHRAEETRVEQTPPPPASPLASSTPVEIEEDAGVTLMWSNNQEDTPPRYIRKHGFAP